MTIWKKVTPDAKTCFCSKAHLVVSQNFVFQNPCATTKKDAGKLPAWFPKSCLFGRICVPSSHLQGLRPPWPPGKVLSLTGLFAMQTKGRKCTEQINNPPGWILIDSFLTPWSESRGAAASLKKFSQKNFLEILPLDSDQGVKGFSAKIQPGELCVSAPNPKHRHPLRRISVKSFNGHHLTFSIGLFRSKIVFKRFFLSGWGNGRRKPDEKK